MRRDSTVSACRRLIVSLPHTSVSPLKTNFPKENKSSFPKLSHLAFQARAHLHLRSRFASRDFSSPCLSPRAGERGQCFSNDDRPLLSLFVSSSQASERRQMRANLPLSIYPSRYVETDVYRRSTGMPPRRLSRSLRTAGHCVISVRHVPLVLGLANRTVADSHIRLLQAHYIHVYT